MSKKVANQQDEFKNVEQALTASEAFIEKYQKQILYGLGIVSAIVVIILASNSFYFKPRAIEAANEMYRSQMYFAVDSFQLALEGDGFETIGFAAIASDYAFTSSANLAKAYAGICSFHLGRFEDAIEYLSGYDGKDNYFSITVVGLIGDSYAELGNNKNAIKFFNKAAESGNDVLAPFYLKKAAVIYEAEGDKDRALRNYQSIKVNYPMSMEAQEVDKYISRLQ